MLKKILYLLLVTTVLYTSYQLYLIYQLSKHYEAPSSYESRIFYEILKNTGQQNNIQLVILNTNEINAFSLYKTIVITKGMLNLLGQNEDELALLLGHEIAHINLAHAWPSILSSRDREAQADKLGAFYTLKSGYNVCKGRMLLVKLKFLFGDCADCSHPDNAYRYTQLQLPQCK